MRFRLLLGFFLVLALAPARGEPDSSLSRYATVEVAPVKTSIYVASVTLDVPLFVRQGQGYQSTYTAKIFPYFFWNEQGQLRIDVSDETLRRFAQGQGFAFTGQAIRDDGIKRAITGQVAPIDASTGKIQVRVFVTKHHSLDFKTTYRLPAAAAWSAGKSSQ